MLAMRSQPATFGSAVREVDCDCEGGFGAPSYTVVSARHVRHASSSFREDDVVPGSAATTGVEFRCENNILVEG